MGAGASFPALPLGAKIATDWAQEYNYPGDNPTNLVEVAQFLAVQFDPAFPKEKILKQLEGATPPDFNVPDEPHALLADLPLPIYLTTNYDDFMVRALKSRYRDLRREFCRWNSLIEDERSVFDEDFTPTVANPVVFHVHGHTLTESIVLTEDDYLYFLAGLGNETLFRVPIKLRLAVRPVFLSDTALRIGISACFSRGCARRAWPAPALPCSSRPEYDELARRQRAYLERYHANMKLSVYWGTAREFAAELRERWTKFKSG